MSGKPRALCSCRRVFPSALPASRRGTAGLLHSHEPRAGIRSRCMRAVAVRIGGRTDGRTDGARERRVVLAPCEPRLNSTRSTTVHSVRGVYDLFGRHIYTYERGDA